MGSLRVGHSWPTSLSLFTFMHWRRKWQPTPVFLPGESQERRSLVDCSLWGRKELDTTERWNWTELGILEDLMELGNSWKTYFPPYPSTPQILQARTLTLGPSFILSHPLLLLPSSPLLFSHLSLHFFIISSPFIFLSFTFFPSIKYQTVLCLVLKCEEVKTCSPFLWNWQSPRCFIGKMTVYQIALILLYFYITLFSSLFYYI